MAQAITAVPLTAPSVRSVRGVGLGGAGGVSRSQDTDTHRAWLATSLGQPAIVVSTVSQNEDRRRPDQVRIGRAPTIEGRLAMAKTVIGGRGVYLIQTVTYHDRHSVKFLRGQNQTFTGNG